MFDIGTKIKRAWNMVWKYKMLWLMAVLFVLFGGAGSSGGSGSGYNFSAPANGAQDFNFHPEQYSANTPAWVFEMGTFFEEKVMPLFTPDRLVGTILVMVAILLGFSIVMGLLTALVRYPAETAILRLVDHYEEDGSKAKFKQGWKLGWNIRAFRVWLIDLIIGAPALVVVGGIGAGFALFLFNFADKGDISRVPGMVALFILGGFLIFVLAILMVFVSVLREYIVRAIAIDGASVGEGFKQGWAMMAHNFKNTFLTWLVMLGINIGLGFALMIAFLLLIPVFAVLVIPGAVVGAIPAAIAYGISVIFTSGFWPWLIAALIAMPFFFMVVFSPVTLIGGWVTLFSSSIWTQTYREMKRGNNPPALPTDVVVPPVK